MKVFKKVILVLRFLVFYVITLIQANLRVAADVLRPGLRIKPGFIKVPLRTKTDFETLIFANLVSMTPGSLSLDVSPDRKFLLVHAMYVDNLNEVKRRLDEEMQNRILEALR